MEYYNRDYTCPTQGCHFEWLSEWRRASLDRRNLVLDTELLLQNFRKRFNWKLVWKQYVNRLMSALGSVFGNEKAWKRSDQRKMLNASLEFIFSHICRVRMKARVRLLKTLQSARDLFVSWSTWTCRRFAGLRPKSLTQRKQSDLKRCRRLMIDKPHRVKTTKRVFYTDEKA